MQKKSNMSLNNLHRDQNQIIKEMTQALPDYLYLYISLDGEKMIQRAKTIIFNSKIYASCPIKFNDPFDCQIQLNFKASKLEKERYIDRVISREDSINSRERKVIKKKMLKDLGSETGRKKITDRVFESLNNIGILCLTEDPESMLMWSHYADNHRGICCRFRMRNLSQINHMHYHLKVKYSKSFPKINLITMNMTENTVRATGTKSEVWAYEKEWRIIFPKIINNNRNLSFPPEMLDGIIFGMKTNSQSEAKIRKLIKDGGNSIAIGKIKNKSNSFDLEINYEG